MVKSSINLLVMIGWIVIGTMAATGFYTPSRFAIVILYGLLTIHQFNQFMKSLIE